MKKKSIFILAVSGLILASCSSDEYVGENPQGITNNTGAIEFSAGSNSVTRADLEGQAAATALNSKFYVYGVKNTATDAVFPSYEVNYQNGTTSASNTKGWEYVTGSQTIKYWDFSATDYTFAAWSIASGNATVTATDVDHLILTATTLADVAGVYFADQKKVEKADFRNVVTLTFRNASAKVRLGIYETIPGYTVTKVTFRSLASSPAFESTDTNAKLEGSFNVPRSEQQTVNVTFNSSTKVAEFDFASTAATVYDFGTFNSTNAIGTTSIAPTWATVTGGLTNNYQYVLPNEDNMAAMTLYVDYTLTAENGTDVINVKGAKATVPVEYMTWHPNYAYTYLFKISDNTNGTTGPGTDPSTDPNDPTNPAGLYPIIFDAVVAQVETGNEQGTTTTVSTPSITTYQAGSVVTEGITYKAGTDIAIKVMNGTTEATGATINTYKLTGAYNYANTLAANTNGITPVTGATISNPTTGTYVIVASFSNGGNTYTAHKVVTVAE